MTYAVYTMAWLPEPYVVVRLPGAIIYRDTNRLAALAVCDSLNRQPKGKS